MTVTPDTGLTAAQREAAERIDALDLEPIAYKLMHPEPGQTVMTLAEADERITAYRCFLKLAAWYPAEPLVPSGAIDEVWHAHILDTRKYAADTREVLGAFLEHFPYLGRRGEEDVTAWHALYARTCDLFRSHFGIELPAGEAACSQGECHCSQGGGGECFSAALDQGRPRPGRSTVPACPWPSTRAAGTSPRDHPARVPGPQARGS